MMARRQHTHSPRTQGRETAALTTLARWALAAAFVALAGALPVAARAAATPGGGAAGAKAADSKGALAKARRAAAADRHREAIRWYLAAIDASPKLRSDVACELGDQYTWADRPDSGVVWYRVYLKAHPGDVDARIGLARALSWNDHSKEALAAYRDVLPDAGDQRDDVRVGIATVTSWQDRLWTARAMYDSILADDPDNLEARIGRAQVINWADRHREARALYQDLLDDAPDNHDVRTGLANADEWMGRPDRAVAVLDVPKPRHHSLVALEHEIRLAHGPRLGYGYDSNRDSDHIERRTHSFRGGVSPLWLARMDAEYSRGTIEQPGLPKVTRDQVMLTLRQRFSDAFALTMGTGFQQNAFNRRALGPEPFWENGFDPFLVDAYATITPVDWVRADLGLYHGAIDNPEPIFRGIDLTETSAGVDWRVWPSILTVTSASHTHYSDSNRRLSFDEHVEWKPPFRLPLRLDHHFTSTTGAAWLGFDKTYDHGYYDPKQYTSLYETLAIEMTFHKRATVDVSGRIAADRENTDDWFPTGSFEASVSARVVGDLHMTAGYYNSRSRLDTRSGYEANGFYVSGEYWFAR